MRIFKNNNKQKRYFAVLLLLFFVLIFSPRLLWYNTDHTHLDSKQSTQQNDHSPHHNHGHCYICTFSFQATEATLPFSLATPYIAICFSPDTKITIFHTYFQLIYRLRAPPMNTL